MFDHRSLSKGRVPLEAFCCRKLKNERFRSLLQSSTILSLMPIPRSFNTLLLPLLGKILC